MSKIAAPGHGLAPGAENDDGIHQTIAWVEADVQEKQGGMDEDDAVLMKIGKQPKMKRRYNFWTRESVWVFLIFGQAGLEESLTIFLQSVPIRFVKNSFEKVYEKYSHQRFVGHDVRNLGLCCGSVLDYFRCWWACRPPIWLVSDTP